MKQVETTAKRLESAIEEGLKQLGATMDDVNVEVLEQGGIFRKARVRLTLVGSTDGADVSAPPVTKDKEDTPKPVKDERKKNPEKPEKPGKPEKPEKPGKPEKPEKAKKAEKPEKAKPEKAKPDAPVQAGTDVPRPSEAKRREIVERAPIAGSRPEIAERRPPVEQPVLSAVQAYLEGILPLMGIEGGANVTDANGVIHAEILASDSAAIGHRGEVLDALQVLLKRVAENAGGGRHAAIVADCQNYRVRREQSLVTLAMRQADRCVKTGRKVVLEPMASAQRKVVHATLNEDERIITKSEGREPNRRVVILPKR